MPASDPGVRPPQQRRSRESLERVLTAGERVLADNGYEGFTIGEVSRRAKVSVGSVYGRFDNKEALIHAIHARMMERLTPPQDDAAATTGDAGATSRRSSRAASTRSPAAWAASGSCCARSWSAARSIRRSRRRG